MKGRDSFTPQELDAIRSLLRRIRSSPREEQKRLRHAMRHEHHFYISDFTDSTAGFTAEDIDALVRSGRITTRER